jgi:hypothetical protein
MVLLILAAVPDRLGAHVVALTATRCLPRAHHVALR